MKVHFIAIGGSVMHSLAIALHRAGHTVSGSDDAINDPARSRLQAHGLLPACEGWCAERIHRQLDAVIVGMHAKKDNPELLHAQALGLPLFSYPQFLYEHARDKKRLVVAGSHGKTTITAMVMEVFRSAGLKFDYLIGASVPGFEHTVQISDDADWMIFEGDEYPDSVVNLQPKFLVYRPHAALISGLSWDHVNVFPTEESYRSAFVSLMDSIPDSGHLVYCADDEQLEPMAKRQAARLSVQAYHTPDYVPGWPGWKLLAEGKTYTTQLLGKHNMQNLLGAATLCNVAAGIPLAQALESLQRFSGAQRRLQQLAHSGRCIVYNDFAHAPSKVAATLQAVRDTHPDRTLVACLELHTFSSLDERFIDRYGQSLLAADIPVVLLDRKTVEKKGHALFSLQRLRQAFADERLQVAYDAEALRSLLHAQQWQHHVLLLMSSGNWGGMDVQAIAKFVSLPQ
ncbi:MAG: Mur ligase family protein [Chitinophagales bacterium]|nr:Mur ligase family protein [Chitinophagales bacterium]